MAQAILVGEVELAGEGLGVLDPADDPDGMTETV
jgi:hypothetical protein